MDLSQFLLQCTLNLLMKVRGPSKTDRLSQEGANFKKWSNLLAQILLKTPAHSVNY